MALNEYIRASDYRHLVQDLNLEAVELFYLPVAPSFAELSIGDSDPDKPGAIAAYMDGSKYKPAVYNGDGTWSPAGGNTYTPDPSLPDPPTKSYLNTNYPSAKVGDVVYWEGTTQVVEAKCYAAGEWNWITKNRCQ